MYTTSSKERPKEIDGGGRGTYCYVPQCKSASNNCGRKKTDIGFFKFPTNPDLRRTWSTVIKQIRKDKFEIKTTTVFCCEFHFNPEEMNVSCVIGRKTSCAWYYTLCIQV